jgi:hypothetical protein
MSQPQALACGDRERPATQQVACGLRTKQRKEAGSADIGNIGVTAPVRSRSPAAVGLHMQRYVQARGN